MQVFSTNIPLTIEYATLISWALPKERVEKLVPEDFLLQTIWHPKEGKKALLSIAASKIQLSPFGFPLLSIETLDYRIYVKHRGNPGIYFLRSLLNSHSIAAALRSTTGYPVQGKRLRFHWEPSGRASIHSFEVKLDFIREHAPFDWAGFSSLQEMTNSLFEARWGYWTQKNGKIKIAAMQSKSPPPLSGRLMRAKLPWLHTQGLLSEEEAQKPHSILFVSRFVMKVFSLKHSQEFFTQIPAYL